MRRARESNPAGVIPLFYKGLTRIALRLPPFGFLETEEVLACLLLLVTAAMNASR
jgi:hypothetical protein